jgi:hypothetical protein
VFGRTARTRFIAVASAFICLIAVATSASATQLKEARFTQVVNKVKLLLQQAAPRPAAVSDLCPLWHCCSDQHTVAWRIDFHRSTITRVGANTIFSLNEGTREMNLIDGAILFQVPKGADGATIAAVPEVIRSGRPCSFIADASAAMLLHDLPSGDQRYSFD